MLTEMVELQIKILKKLLILLTISAFDFELCKKRIGAIYIQKY